MSAPTLSRQPIRELSLYGCPCGFCGQPASSMTLYATHRVIWHPGKPCVIPRALVESETP